MIKRIVLALLVLLGTAAGVAYYAWPLSPPSEAQSARGGGREARPPPVLAAEVVTEAAPVQLATIGRVQPIANVAVRSRIDGQIAQVAVERRPGGQGGRRAVRARQPAAAGDARPGRGHPGARPRAARQRAARPRPPGAARPEGFRLETAARRGPHQTSPPPRRRSRRDEAQVESAKAQLSYTDDPSADRRSPRERSPQARQHGQGRTTRRRW